MSNLSIYQEKILSLAAKNKKIIALKDFNRSFEMRNPMCGDEVKVRIKLVEDKIIDISAVVRGCALCEASAGLVVVLFKNKNVPDEKFLNEYYDIMDKTIVTKGNEGCLFQNKMYETEDVQVKDISGAGDTFLAGLVVEYLKSNDIVKSIKFAQECTKIVVQKHGVSTI